MVLSLSRGFARPAGPAACRSLLSSSHFSAARAAAAATTSSATTVSSGYCASVSQKFYGPAIHAKLGGGGDCCRHVRVQQHQQQQWRSLGTFRATSPRRDEFVIDLPSLGDSITEGTLVQWCKAVGDEVSEDEVIAVVETDKVSVDVRSAHVGVVVKLFAAVDDAVQVGTPLCIIDGDEASVVKAKLEADELEEAANAPPPEIKKPVLEDAVVGAFMAGADFVAPKKKKHEPLIKFLGKRAVLREQKASEEAAPAEPARHRHTPGALEFSQIVGGAAFGRPALTEEEMDAVDSGGAECAPNLRYVDSSRWA